METAVYAGSFDPPTLGHEDLAKRALSLSGRLILAIGVNSAKTPPFLSLDERMELLREMSRRIHPNPDRVSVDSFSGLLVHYCQRQNAKLIIRGLRAVTDFEYEISIAHANADQDPTIDTVLLPTQPRFSFVSSSLVKEIARNGGDISHYVQADVEALLKRKLALKGG